MDLLFNDLCTFEMMAFCSGYCSMIKFFTYMTRPHDTIVHTILLLLFFVALHLIIYDNERGVGGERKCHRIVLLELDFYSKRKENFNRNNKRTVKGMMIDDFPIPS
jgi:hypothetical protein